MLTFIKDQLEKFVVPGTCYLMIYGLANILSSSICCKEKRASYYNKNLKAENIL